ncbi:MAG: alkaline phosphatase family protein, partial [Bacteriovorax sp.]
MRITALVFLFTYTQLAFAKPIPQKILLVGFDGCRRSSIVELLAQKKLPNLQSLIDTGSYVEVRVNEGATETKPGWSQILSGYNSNVTKVYTNKFYEPIPAGLTLFERLKKNFGKDFKTFFVTGKTNNTGIRGPHKICINCLSRFKDTKLKTEWWDENKPPITMAGKRPIYDQRKGEPYFNAIGSIDYYKNSLLQASNVANEGIGLLDKYQHHNFFGFIHFEEPDEQGHLFREGSKEYINAIIEADRNLGRILNKIEALKLKNDIKIFVTTDHGFDKGLGSHHNAPDIWLVSNIKAFKKTGDRRDFAPTILKILRFDITSIKPSLNGSPL